MSLKSSLDNAVCPGRRPARLLLAAIVLVAGTALVGAVEDDEVVEGPIISNPRNRVPQMGMANFDQLLFQNDQNKTVGEQRIRNRMELQLAEIDQACQLSEAQKQKLQLAARGDLHRFLSDAATLRLKFEKLIKQQKQNADAFNEVYQQMWQDIQPLQLRMNMGLTEGSDSLFIKALPQTLSTEQQAKYDVVCTERRRFRYEANIAVCLLNLEDVVYLSESQRATITKLLLAMPPPKQTGQYELQVVLCRIGMLPVDRLEPLFKPRQWRTFKAQVDQYNNTRQAWIEAGILDPEEFVVPTAVEKP